MFNKKGLQSVLSALKLKTLIRTAEKGHSFLIGEEYPVGVVRNFDDDTCYTVITSSDPHVSSCELSMFSILDFCPLQNSFCSL